MATFEGILMVSIIDIVFPGTMYFFQSESMNLGFVVLLIGVFVWVIMCIIVKVKLYEWIFVVDSWKILINTFYNQFHGDYMINWINNSKIEIFSSDFSSFCPQKKIHKIKNEKSVPNIFIGPLKHTI